MQATEICDRNGILLILDEVMVGCGRSGKWFAAEPYLAPITAASEAAGITPSGWVISATRWVTGVSPNSSKRANPTGLAASAPARAPRCVTCPATCW